MKNVILLLAIVIGYNFAFPPAHSKTESTVVIVKCNYYHQGVCHE